jgi:threonine synthase
MQDAYNAGKSVLIPAPVLAKLRAVFCSAAVSNTQTIAVMADTFNIGGGSGGGGVEGYLMCPHTAVAMAAVAIPGLLYRGDTLATLSPPGSPVVIVATAHPSKFGNTARG